MSRALCFIVGVAVGSLLTIIFVSRNSRTPSASPGKTASALTNLNVSGGGHKSPESGNIGTERALSDSMAESLRALGEFGATLNPRLDMSKVRDLAARREFQALDALKGEPETGDLNDLFSVLAGMNQESVAVVFDARSRLLKWIDSIEGERASEVLLRLLTENLLPDSGDWRDAAFMLGKRDHPGSQPYLESIAGEASDKGEAARAALIVMDADRYLPEPVGRLGNPENRPAWNESLETIRAAAGYSGKANMRLAVPTLQRQFFEANDPEDRMRLIEVLDWYEDYWDVPDVRQWLIKHLGEAIDSTGERYSDREKFDYKLVLKYMKN